MKRRNVERYLEKLKMIKVDLRNGHESHQSVEAQTEHNIVTYSLKNLVWPRRIRCGVIKFETSYEFAADGIEWTITLFGV